MLLRTLLLVWLSALPAAAMVTATTPLAEHEPALPVVRLADGDGQTEIDAAVAACSAGCNLVLEPGATVTGQVRIDGAISGDVWLTGFEGTRGTLQAPVLSSVVGTGSNACGVGFTCQDEDAAATLCITDAGGQGATDGCTGTGTYTGSVHIGGRVDFDGRMDEQPAPRPEDCIDGATCTLRWSQRAVEIEAGAPGGVRFHPGVTIRDYNNFGVLVQGVEGVEIEGLDVDRIGCNPSSGWSPCGAHWTGVPPSSGTLARQTDGFGVNFQLAAHDGWLHHSTFGDRITKHAAEIFGDANGCGGVNAPQDVLFEHLVSGSPVGANGACRPIIRDSVISGVRKPGEEGTEVAWGAFLGAGNGGARLERLVISDIQRHGVHVSSPTEDDIELLDLTIDEPCQTATGGNCAGINLSGAGTQTDVRVYRNRIDAEDAEIGIRIDQVLGAKLALNLVTGGAGSTLERALWLEDAQGVECRYNVLDWTTQVGDVIVIQGGGSHLFQADCFGELEQYQFNATGTAERFVETGSPSASVDCQGDLSGTGCYAHFALVTLPDTQGSVSLGSNPKRASKLESTMDAIKATRDAFQLERDISYAHPEPGQADEFSGNAPWSGLGTISYPSEAYNVKAVAGLGDIVTTASGGDAAARMIVTAAAYERLADHVIPIPHVEPPGNHDVVNSTTPPVDASLYATHFAQASRYATGRAVVRHSGGLSQTLYSSDPAYLAVALRFHVLDQWVTIVASPWQAKVATEWRGLYQSWLDDYPAELVAFVEHEITASGGTDLANEVCGTSMSAIPWTALLNDTSHTNAGLGYTSWYLASSGHSIGFDGAMCRTKLMLDSGDDFFWSYGNWQSSPTFQGGGMHLIYDHDALAETVRMVAHSAFYDDDLDVAEAAVQGLGPGELRDRTETINLRSRIGPGAPAAGLDLGDLDLAASRVGPFYVADEAEAAYVAAQAWPEFDATCTSAPCASGRTPYTDAPGDVMDGCSPADPADDGGRDWSQIHCMLATAPAQSVVYLPAGTYDMGADINEMIRIGRGDVVLRGAGRTASILNARKRSANNSPANGRAPCSDSHWSENENCGAMVVSVGTTHQAGGTAVAWTAGFTPGTTVVTVADAAQFDVGEWILLEIPDARNDCDLALPVNPTELDNLDHALGYVYRIVGKSGTDLTIDRPLTFDYEWGCDPGFDATARPWTPIERVGVEALGFATDPEIAQDDVEGHPFVHLGAGTAISWVVGNRMERVESTWIQVTSAARVLIRSNDLLDCGKIDSTFNTACINVKRGARDVEISDNWLQDYVTGTNLNQGPAGIVVAYNFQDHGTPPNGPERAIFVHGMAARTSLIEGNDVDGELLTADHWWGPAFRIVAFLNRIRGTANRQVLSTNHDKASWCDEQGTPDGVCNEFPSISCSTFADCPQWPVGYEISWVGNHFNAAYQTAVINPANFPDGLGNSQDFDGHGTTDAAEVVSMHVEKNVYRLTSTCTGDPTSGRCGFHQDSPRSDTHCGTAAGPNDCSGGTGDNAGGDAAPGGWATDDVPESMAWCGGPPRFWCDEACDWDDVHAKIGAWGDDFASTLCKTPAQLRADAETCTPVSPPYGVPCFETTPVP